MYRIINLVAAYQVWEVSSRNFLHINKHNMRHKNSMHAVPKIHIWFWNFDLKLFSKEYLTCVEILWEKPETNLNSEILVQSIGQCISGEQICHQRGLGFGRIWAEWLGSNWENDQSWHNKDMNELRGGMGVMDGIYI